MRVPGLGIRDRGLRGWQSKTVYSLQWSCVKLIKRPPPFSHKHKPSVPIKAKRHSGSLNGGERKVPGDKCNQPIFIYQNVLAQF